MRGHAGRALAGDLYLARIGLQHPGQEVEERRLASAVRSDDRPAFSPFEIEADSIGGLETAERLLQGPRAKDARHAATSTSAGCFRKRATTFSPTPSIPPGITSTITSRIAPKMKWEYSV